MLASSLPGVAAGRLRTYLPIARYLTWRGRGEGSQFGVRLMCNKVWVERAVVLLVRTRGVRKEQRSCVLKPSVGYCHPSPGKCGTSAPGRENSRYSNSPESLPSPRPAPVTHSPVVSQRAGGPGLLPGEGTRICLSEDLGTLLPTLYLSGSSVKQGLLTSGP